jgi:hypothetical protein
VQVPGLVGHDAQQPGPEGRSVAEAVEPGVRLDEGFLHDVLRVRSGAEQRGRAQRNRRMADYQSGVRVAISRAHPGHQLGIGLGPADRRSVRLFLL